MCIFIAPSALIAQIVENSPRGFYPDSIEGFSKHLENEQKE